MSVLHAAPPAHPWRSRHAWRLPGTAPCAPETWLSWDEAYADQMRERRHLLDTRPSEVCVLSSEARPAAEELLTRVTDHLTAHGPFDREGARVTGPDGHRQTLDPTRPLDTLGRIAQEDFCLLTKAPGATEHRLTGAVLCFPSGWTLTEKKGRPLGSIHIPVPRYTEDIARRVQRLCDAITWERPLTRANAHRYDFANLFDPCRESDPRREKPDHARYLRVERQTLRRLPDTGAVVFTIHTSLAALADLSPEDRAALFEAEAQQ